MTQPHENTAKTAFFVFMSLLRSQCGPCTGVQGRIEGSFFGDSESRFSAQKRGIQKARLSPVKRRTRVAPARAAAIGPGPGPAVVASATSPKRFFSFSHVLDDSWIR